MTDQASAITKSAAIAEDLFCQSCGYNLRGLTGAVCPECGGSLAGVRSEICNIPWVHRRELGRWRAYWKTIAFVMFRQRQFAEEMARPVGFRDSQRFRWLTIMLACMPAGVAIAATYALVPPVRHRDQWVTLLYAEVWPIVVEYVCFLLFLAAATGLPSYFFQPKDIPVAQRNRAIALSYYACGPLAITFIPAICYVAGLALRHLHETTSLLFFLLAFHLPLGQLFAWWADLLHLSRRLTPQKTLQGSVFVLLPMLWFSLVVVLLILLPMVVLGVVVVFASLEAVS